MKRFLYILGIFLVILLGTYFQYQSCCKHGAEQYDEAVKDGEPLAKFSFKDSDFRTKCKENFNFLPSSYAIEKPVSACIQEAVGNLKTHLGENPNKVLKIRGYYADFEENTSVFPNLGLARANAVKSYFIGQGINKKQLGIDAALSNKLTAEMTAIKGGTAYNLVSEDEKSLLDRIKSLKIFGKDLEKEPIHLYFDTGEVYINLTAAEREKICRINEYLSQVDGAKLIVVGHTDNIGEKDMNMQLSKKRANFVKQYLIKNDFDTESIETRGEGSDAPIADNKTEEGRLQNRRVTLTLKQTN